MSIPKIENPFIRKIDLNNSQTNGKRKAEEMVDELMTKYLSKKIKLNQPDYSAKDSESSTSVSEFNIEQHTVATEFSESIEENSETENDCFEPLDIKEVYDPIKHQNFKTIGYKCVHKAIPPMSSMVIPLTGHEDRSTTIHYLFFFHREINGQEEIFALTSGQRSIQLIAPYCDYNFTRKIAKRILNPEFSTLNSSYLDGNTLSSNQIFKRAKKLLLSATVHKMVRAFKCRLKPNSSPYNLSAFQTKTGQTSTKTPQFHVSREALRIAKTFYLSDFTQMLDLFSKIDRNEPTQTGDSNLEEDDKNFDFLDHIQLVDKSIEKKLESYVSEKIKEIISKGSYALFDFYPSGNDYKHYQAAEKYRLRQKNEEDSKILKEWNFKPESADIFCVLINWANNQEGISLDWLQRIELCYQNNKKWQNKNLLNCFQGEIKLNDNSYFRLNGIWVEASFDYLKLMHKDFNDVLKEHIIKKDHPAFLPEVWPGNSRPKAHILLKEIIELTHGQQGGNKREAQKQAKAFLDRILQDKVSYVNETNQQVMFSHLEGEILEELIIFQNQVKIEQFLFQRVLDQEKFTQFFGINADKIYTALVKERKVAIRRDEKIYIINPLLSESLTKALGLTSNHVNFLSEKCKAYYNTMDENAYSQRYLDKTEYLVGDKICPFGIELFDVLKFTDKDTYLYQIKEGFDHSMRDACSQIANSAQKIYELRSGEKNGDPLEEFWREAMKVSDNEGYRKKVKDKLQQFGKAQFFDLFQKPRKITFILAFLDEHTQERNLSDELNLKESFSQNDFEDKEIFEELKDKGYLDSAGRLTSTFDRTFLAAFKRENFSYIKKPQAVYMVLSKGKTLFESNIAKMEVIKLKKRLEKLGFGLGICQISRDPSFYPGSPDDMSNSFVLKLQLKEGSTFSYGDNKWQIKKTLGDGVCALHALLGEEINETYQFNDARKILLEKLKKFLNVDNKGFKNLIIHAYYTTSIKNYIEAWKHKDNQKISHEVETFFDDKKVKQLIEVHIQTVQVLRNEQKQLEQRLDNEFAKLFSSPNQQLVSELLGILRKASSKYKDNDDEKLKNLFTKKEQERKEAYIAMKDEILKFIEKNVDIKEIMTFKVQQNIISDQLNSFETKIQKEEKELYLNPFLANRYLECINDPLWYFHSEELGIVAHLFNIKVTLLNQNNFGEILVAYKFKDDEENKRIGLSTEEFASASQELRQIFPDHLSKDVVIFHQGNHYSKCVQIP